MSKSQDIRDAIEKHGELPLSKLMETANLQNRKKTIDLCVFLRGKGELTIDRTGEEPVIGKGTGKPTNPRFVKPKPATPKKSREIDRAARPFKVLVDKHAAPITGLRDLLFDNLIASVNNLAATLRREVEGIETNPTLIAAIEQQERAANLAMAVR
jgi:hypothetical protein